MAIQIHGDENLNKIDALHPVVLKEWKVFSGIELQVVFYGIATWKKNLP